MKLLKIPFAEKFKIKRHGLHRSPCRAIGLRKAFRYLRWVRGLDHGGQVARAVVGDGDINPFAEWQKDFLSLRQRL